MIPIRLWSVVVTHEVQPVRSGSTPPGDDLRDGGECLLGGGGHEGGYGVLLLDLLALRGGGVVGGLDVGLALVEPLLVLGRRHRPDRGGHVRVVAPAELGALPGEHGARELARDLEPGVVRVAGDGVELAAELGDPPRVRDVLEPGC